MLSARQDRAALQIIDEYSHAGDIKLFHLESAHTPKLHVELRAHTHIHTHTSLLKDVPPGLIHLTWFPKLTCDRLQKKPSEHLFNIVLQENSSLLTLHQSWPMDIVPTVLSNNYKHSLQIKWAYGTHRNSSGMEKAVIKTVFQPQLGFILKHYVKH